MLPPLPPNDLGNNLNILLPYPNNLEKIYSIPQNLLNNSNKNANRTVSNKNGILDDNTNWFLPTNVSQHGNLAFSNFKLK